MLFACIFVRLVARIRVVESRSAFSNTYSDVQGTVGLILPFPLANQLRMDSCRQHYHYFDFGSGILIHFPASIDKFYISDIFFQFLGGKVRSCPQPLRCQLMVLFSLCSWATFCNYIPSLCAGHQANTEGMLTH